MADQEQVPVLCTMFGVEQAVLPNVFNEASPDVRHYQHLPQAMIMRYDIRPILNYI